MFQVHVYVLFSALTASVLTFGATAFLVKVIKDRKNERIREEQRQIKDALSADTNSNVCNLPTVKVLANEQKRISDGLQTRGIESIESQKIKEEILT